MSLIGSIESPDLDIQFHMNRSVENLLEVKFCEARNSTDTFSVGSHNDSLQEDGGGVLAEACSDLQHKQQAKKKNRKRTNRYEICQKTNTLRYSQLETVAGRK